MFSYKIKWVVMSMALLLIANSCSLMGPSDQDVVEALDPVLEGFMSVPIFQQGAVDEFEYMDSVDRMNSNDNETISQNVTYIVDSDANQLFCEGVCIFKDYIENRSGYKISGTVNYMMEGEISPKNENITAEYIFDLQYENGKIQSIAFSLNYVPGQPVELTEILVNGKLFESKEALMGNFVRSLQTMKLM